MREAPATPSARALRLFRRPKNRGTLVADRRPESREPGRPGEDRGSHRLGGRRASPLRPLLRGRPAPGGGLRSDARSLRRGRLSRRALGGRATPPGGGPARLEACRRARGSGGAALRLVRTLRIRGDRARGGASRSEAASGAALAGALRRRRGRDGDALPEPQALPARPPELRPDRAPRLRVLRSGPPRRRGGPAQPGPARGPAWSHRGARPPPRLRGGPPGDERALPAAEPGLLLLRGEQRLAPRAAPGGAAHRERRPDRLVRRGRNAVAARLAPAARRPLLDRCGSRAPPAASALADGQARPARRMGAGLRHAPGLPRLAGPAPRIRELWALREVRAHDARPARLGRASPLQHLSYDRRDARDGRRHPHRRSERLLHLRLPRRRPAAHRSRRPRARHPGAARATRGREPDAGRQVEAQALEGSPAPARAPGSRVCGGGPAAQRSPKSACAAPR